MNPEANPLLALIPAFIGQALGYFSIVGATWFVVWRLLARRLAARKLPAPVSTNRAQLQHELKYSFVTLAFATLGVLIVNWMTANGWARLSTEASEFSGPQLAVTFLSLLLLNDVWFYAVHRALHTPWAFKHIHSIHHRSVEVTPFTSYSFHPLEGFLLGAWIYPVALVVPLYLPLLGALQVIGLTNNIMSHLGYELWPAWLIRVPGLKWINSATFHSMHHTKVKGNFGLMLRVWDRLFGTALPGYDEAFVSRNTGDKSGAITPSR